MYQRYLEDPIFKQISEIVTKEKVEAYVIGGYVRDCILGRKTKDIDILIVGSGIDIAQKFADSLTPKPKVNVFKTFGTAMVKTTDIEVEFVGARKESYNRNSRNPIVENGTLEDDINRRDFTINTLGFNLNKKKFGELLDKYNGLEAIEQQVIKTPLDPDITFSDDPLRMLRAIRFATQLNFRIDDECFQAIKRNAERIEIITKERVMDELNKIMLSPVPSIGFKLLDKAGLLNHILPELLELKGTEKKNNISYKDNFKHTLEVVDNVSMNTNKLYLRWAALLHDIAKPKTKRFTGKAWTFHGHEIVGKKMVKTIFKKLKLPLNDKMVYVQKLVGLHLRPIALVSKIVTDSAVRRLLFEAGDDIDDLMLLAEADITSKNQFKVKLFRQNFALVRKKLVEIEEKDRVRNFQPPVSGDIIMKSFDIEPCREVGEIKAAIKNAILDGKIQNNFEEAYNLMIEEGKKYNFTIKK